MVFNIGVRTGRMVAAVVAGAALLGACGGGPEYTYIESDDGHMYAKIPSDWNVDREGAVDYTLIQKDNNVRFAFTVDDSTQPWRADFSQAGPGGDGPVGFIEAQHVDARVRSDFRLGTYIDQFNDQQREGHEDYERSDFRREGLIGYRVSMTLPGDDPVEVNEVWFMDQRRSGVYRATVVCSVDCADDYEREIDEIISTFTVEP